MKLLYISFFISLIIIFSFWLAKIDLQNRQKKLGDSILPFYLASQKEKEALYDKPYTTLLIKVFATRYQVTEELLECIVRRESGWNQYASGDNSLAKGYAQFHLPTWKAFRRLAGWSQEDQRTDQVESLRTLAWALGQNRGYERNWTTYPKCKNLLGI